MYLFAAGTNGYGQPSVPLLKAASTGYADSIGAYVLTASDGSFSISGDYTCAPNDQVYLYGLGGSPSGPGGVVNSAAGFLAVLGNCPASGGFATQTPYVSVNEISTIAAAYSFAGFATDAVHVSSSGSVRAKVGIANAFAAAANLVNLASGSALNLTPAGNGIVPTTTINTLGNILASCVNTAGPSSSQCATLFSNAQAGGLTGGLPSDTASAAINIAHYPGTAVAALYSLQIATAPFQSGLSAQPNDFILPVLYTGSGALGSTGAAVDSQGNIWFSNNPYNSPVPGSVTKLSPLGVLLSPATGFTGGGLHYPTSIAIDGYDNAWVASAANTPIVGAVVKFSNSGVALSPPAGFVELVNWSPTALAIDGGNNVWVFNDPTRSIYEFSNSGLSGFSPSTGYAPGLLLNSAAGIAIDQSGDVWLTSGGNDLRGEVAEISGTGNALSPPSGYTDCGVSIPGAVAVDASGAVWVANANGYISKFPGPGGAPCNPTGYTGGGYQGAASGKAIAIDGLGNVWAPDGQFGVAEFSNMGQPLSPSNGYGTNASAPYLSAVKFASAMALDGSGNVWLGASSMPTSYVTELVGAAAPVVTPLAVGIATNSLGTRP